MKGRTYKRKSRTSLNFTFILNTLYLASILFKRLKFSCVNVCERTLNVRMFCAMQNFKVDL